MQTRWALATSTGEFIEQPGVRHNFTGGMCAVAIVGGEIGILAVAVAEHATDDALAAEVLIDAGVELARLANAITHRYGKRFIVVTGRAPQLHPLIEVAMPADAVIKFRQM